jgi:hypothetical protein
VRLIFRDSEIGQLGSMNRTMLARIVATSSASFSALFHFRQQLPGSPFGARSPASFPGRNLAPRRCRIMTNHHLMIDFEALAIDLHLSEETQIAVLTFVSTQESLEVSLPLQALEQFRDRISRMPPEVTPRTQMPEPPTDLQD